MHAGSIVGAGSACSHFVEYISNIDGERIVLIAVFPTNHRRKSWFNRSFFSRRMFAG